MSELYVESPLAHRVKRRRAWAFELREIADRGMIDLRGSASDKKFMARGEEGSGPRSPQGAAHQRVLGRCEGAVALHRPVAHPLLARQGQ